MSDAKKLAAEKAERIVSAIDALFEDGSQENFESVISALSDASFFLPTVVNVSNRDIAKLRSGAKVNKYRMNTKDPMKFEPAYLRDESGDMFIPIFSDQTQIPQRDRGRFTYISIKFVDVCTMAKHNRNVHSIIVNPFTKGFKVTDSIIQKYGQSEEGQKLNRGFVSELKAAADEASPIIETAAAYFKAQPTVSAAYICEMLRNGERCYVITAETTLPDPKELYSALFARVKDIPQNGMRIHFSPFEMLGERLKEADIAPFYTK